MMRYFNIVGAAGIEVLMPAPSGGQEYIIEQSTQQLLGLARSR